MTLEFKTYRIEKVGKLIKDTKKRHIWKLMHGGKYYEIKAMESLMSGMFRIMVQNDKLFSAKVTDDHKRRGIELEYEGLNFRFKKVSESFDLYVNMNRFVPGATISGPTPPTNKINTMTRAEPTRQYNEDQKMQVVDKSISESYLVYNQDFDNSDEEDGFDNFGNKDKTTPRQNLTESRVRPGAKDTELNTITIQNKPTEVKGSMQFAFKKPGAPNVNTSSIGGQAPGNNSINLSANKEVKGSAKPFSKFGETPNPSDNDFLSFDALEAKPISAPVKPLQQRTNASALNFGWNAHGNTQGGLRESSRIKSI